MIPDFLIWSLGMGAAVGAGVAVAVGIAVAVAVDVGWAVGGGAAAGAVPHATNSIAIPKIAEDVSRRRFGLGGRKFGMTPLSLVCKCEDRPYAPRVPTCIRCRQGPQGALTPITVPPAGRMP